MSLLNKIENNDETNAADTTAKAAAPATVKPTATAEAKTTALAAKPAAALQVKVAQNMRVMEAFKDALPVDYNTLTQVIASNGNFMDRETKTVMGDTLIFEVLSYQDSYVVSPEDDDAPDELVRYSVDGKVCTDGTDVQEHITFLKENGYAKARLKQRVVVVGAIESASKTDKYNGTLVQFDLSPASRTMWMRFMANAAYGLNTNRYTAEEVKRVKATTNVASRGSDSYTQATFEVCK